MDDEVVVVPFKAPFPSRVIDLRKVVSQQVRIDSSEVDRMFIRLCKSG